MTQHIIDTDELEKLPRYEQDKFLVRYEDVVKLIANSPQADSYGQDFNLEYTCKRIRRLLNAMGMIDPSDGKDHVLMGMLFTLLGTICLKLEKPPTLETAWLVEKVINGQTMYASINCEGIFQWTGSNQKALRLSRKEDAEQVASHFNEEVTRVAQHMWG